MKKSAFRSLSPFGRRPSSTAKQSSAVETVPRPRFSFVSWFARLRRRPTAATGGLKAEGQASGQPALTVVPPPSSAIPRAASDLEQRGITFIGDLQSLASSLTKPGSAVITGDLVFATLRSTSPGSGFTRLVPRVITPWYKVRHRRHMYLWVHNDLVAAVKSARVTFAVDGLLRYGKRTKGRVIIFNGYRTANGTYLHWYRFTNGELLDIQERVLPTDDTRYETEVTSLLKNIAIEADTTLYWTAPLPQLHTKRLTPIGVQPFQRIPPVTLARRAPLWQRFGYIVVPAMALALYAITIGYEWSSFALARSQYQALASAGPKSALSLDVLRARQAWLAAPNPMQARIAPLPGLFHVIAAHPTWQIQKLQLSAPTKAPPATTMGGAQQQMRSAPDLLLTLSLPKDDNLSPLDQAQGPLIELANATGLPLHVAAAPHGLVEQTVDGGRKLLFVTIESTAAKRVSGTTSNS